jgi:hypothetical protein
MSENKAVLVAALLLLAAGILFAQVENAADADAGVFGESAITPGSQAFVSDSVEGTSPQSNGASVSIRAVGSATATPRRCFPRAERAAPDTLMLVSYSTGETTPVDFQ